MSYELLSMLIFIGYILIGIIIAAISKVIFPNYNYISSSDPPPLISGMFWPLFIIIGCSVFFYNYLVKLLENKFGE